MEARKYREFCFDFRCNVTPTTKSRHRKNQMRWQFIVSACAGVDASGPKQFIQTFCILNRIFFFMHFAFDSHFRFGFTNFPSKARRAPMPCGIFRLHFHSQLFDTLASFCHLCDNLYLYTVDGGAVFVGSDGWLAVVVAAVAAAAAATVKTMNKHFLWDFFFATPNTCVLTNAYDRAHHADCVADQILDRLAKPFLFWFLRISFLIFNSDFRNGNTG